MLELLGLTSLEDLVDHVVPDSIRSTSPLDLPEALTESNALELVWRLGSKNQVFRSYIGMGYYDCITPSVIQRNILENPGWYTQYTPYQAEIAQGRLEALLNFQTMVADLTGMELANSSLLDEATAAAEAMALAWSASGDDERCSYFISKECHPQTIDVVRTRADRVGIELAVDDPASFECDNRFFGALVQYPTSDGALPDYLPFCQMMRESGALLAVATDLLSLTLLTPPGEWGADVVVGSTQRFGVPLGFGGPHAAFFATKDEFKRLIPGRIVGVSKDSAGNAALRLSLQTREQHIRRDKATSNICTAQVLLAIMASMYAVYHGPHGLRRIAEQIHKHTSTLALGLRRFGFQIRHDRFFDTLRVETPDMEGILERAKTNRMNFRVFPDKSLGISVDETTGSENITEILEVISGQSPLDFSPDELSETLSSIEGSQVRSSQYLTHPVFNSCHSETELLRYIHRLQAGDLSLTMSMIPLGSCTMKLNATTEMLPVTWPQWNRIHPFAPSDQVEGYRCLIDELEKMLCEITGMFAVSLQPNSGAQGEYAGLLAIRAFLAQKEEKSRDVCLIPRSAHGTNPASAVMAGLKVVSVACDDEGNVDLSDLNRKAEKHGQSLAALMVTYPSTHGVFEESIKEICRIVHEHGGQVYMDGANLNALVGLCRPGEFGVDVCHLNLHKTFAIPHGGGGPGVGPIVVAEHLQPFLPGHFLLSEAGDASLVGPISSTPWGSASILPISWAYIRMMGAPGLKKATQVAILNANYIARRLQAHYPVLYKGRSGMVAHECILDCRNLKKSVGVSVTDIAKRLMDYGFHAPTISWPVVETMMVEPTESESKMELDRFCDAMILIRKEIEEIELGVADPLDNVLKNAPHTASAVSSDSWSHPYSREKAAYPAPWLKRHKFWTLCGRIDDTYGDRNLFCTCVPPEELEA